MILKNSIEIKTTPDKIFKFLTNLDKHYQEWHPDHVKYVKETGGVNEGDIVYYEEYYQGKLYKARSKITKVEINKIIELKPLFPMSIVCKRHSFIIEPKGEGCVFTATASFRFGWLISKLAKSRLEAVKTHIKEEGENLKRLLEGEKNI